MTRIWLLVLTGVFLAGQGLAQVSEMVRVPAPEDPASLPLYEDDGAGLADTEIWTDAGTERWARNVSHPTLLPVLPDPEVATGAAVIVVPGGGFQFVSIDNEGYPIAHWLAEQGVAAFVLKYRVMQTPEPEAEFDAHMQRMFAPTPDMTPIDVRPGIPPAVEDAQAALSMVEARAVEWGIDPDRIGMLGFSAGAITTLGTVQAEDGAPRPDFIGYIYGPMTATTVPETAPPMFVALAADDALFGQQGFGLVEAWQSAGKPVELHFYDSGGHGFGSYRRGNPADGWFDQFLRWMDGRGLREAEADQEPVSRRYRD